jgi:hypothetical protein
MVGALLALGVATAPSAFADTTQSNGCASVTPGISTFAVPITGVGSPNPVTYPNPITLSGLSMTIQVDSVLIGAGVGTGLVSAADSLADLGVMKNDGQTASQSAGINAVQGVAGAAKLMITGTHTVEGTQTATNPAPVATTFWVTADSVGGSVVVYDSVTNPPNLNGIPTPNVPDPTRVGHVLTGNLSVPIALGNLAFTPSGGNVTFSEKVVVPSSLSAPSAADKGAAPLQLAAQINGAVNVNFWCWTGAADAAGTNLVPGPASPIDTVTVNTPPTAPSCVAPPQTSVGAGQSVLVTPNCSDPNGNFTPSGTSIVVVGGPNTAAGTAVVQANGQILYTNTTPSATSDSFSFTATDDTSLTSAPATPVSIKILGNQCDATAASCSLRQTLLVPVLPSTLTMSDAAAYGNPTFSQVVLGGVVTGTGCTPGPIVGGHPTPALVLNGQPQTACGAMNPLTIINARGTDPGWSVTGQVTDFIDGQRGADNAAIATGGPGASACTSPINIAMSPPDNHCIPGGNLGWVPVAQIIDPSVPGDTASITAGSFILPPSSTPQTPPLFPPDLVAPRQNTNSVKAPPAGLHTAAQTLCASPANQSGGTFQCDAGLLLAVPGSAAAGTYAATLTLTLA